MWQGLLIVAPAILLAGIGLSFLRRSQALAEHEIKARAARFAEELALVRLPNALWGEVPAFSPVDLRRVSSLSLANDPVLVLSKRKLPCVAAVLDSSKRLIFPPSIPPWPPAQPLDLTALDPGMLEDWKCCQTTSDSTEASMPNADAFSRFLARGPPPEFAAAAEYRLGLALEARSGFAEARRRYDSILKRFPSVTSESGVPWKTLAELRIIRLAVFGQSSASERRGLIADMAAEAVLKPSAMSETILERLERFEADQTGPAHNARHVWEAHQSARNLLDEFPIASSGSPDIPRWLEDANGTQWLRLTLPRRNYDWLLFVRENVARRAAIECVASQARPSYFKVATEVAGHVLVVAPARAVQVASVNTSDRLDSPFPGINVGIFLADAKAPYAELRALAAWIRTIIILSAVAVLVGFALAVRSYSRQRQLAEMKSNFLSSVSHELRAPLASIRLMAEEVVAMTPPSASNDYHRLIAQECRRLSTLVENVLDFTRGERGSRQYQLASTDLVELVEDIARLMRGCAAEKGLSLETRSSEKQLIVAVDAKAIQQALVNLVDNAIKYSPAGTTVSLGAEADPAARVARLWVADQGVGIPAAEHERIFERFYRCGFELRRETQGAGLGLAIVKQVIEAHNGRVTVQSTPGQGSRFALELPLHHPAP